MTADRAVRVLVPGGAGFIGRHAVAALLDAGAEAIIGTRRPRDLGRQAPPHPRAGEAAMREIRMERLTSEEDWLPLIDDVDTVLNCVGILRQRGRET